MLLPTDLLLRRAVVGILENHGSVCFNREYSLFKGSRDNLETTPLETIVYARTLVLTRRLQ